jgi:hypothetical protein
VSIYYGVAVVGVYWGQPADWHTVIFILQYLDLGFKTFRRHVDLVGDQFILVEYLVNRIFYHG